MLLTILKIAAAIFIARLAWLALPIILGYVITTILAVLAPVTALRYLFARKKAQAPSAVPWNSAECVTKYFADFAKQEEVERKVSR